jgi:hypothetical protein
MPVDLGRCQHRLDGSRRPIQGHVQYAAFLVRLRVADLDFEHEPIHLGFRQRVRALLLDRVLGRHHQEQAFQRIRRIADRDLPLLHGFQQCRLDLGRRPVDFVGQDEIGKDRAFARFERAVARHIDHRADQVGRQQVRRELNPLEAGRQGFGQGLDGRRLGQTRHALQEDMPVGQQAHQQAGDHFLLADDGLAKFRAQPVDQLRLFRDPVFDLMNIHAHHSAPLSVVLFRKILRTRGRSVKDGTGGRRRLGRAREAVSLSAFPREGRLVPAARSGASAEMFAYRTLWGGVLRDIGAKTCQVFAHHLNSGRLSVRTTKRVADYPGGGIQQQKGGHSLASTSARRIS